MRIPVLYQLALLLRRSPETEFERIMLLQRIYERRLLISIGAVAALMGAAAAVSVKRTMEEELQCLALNVYFEARGEPYEGQVAVAHVVMNRAEDRRFPGYVCGVVQQGGKDSHDCQFSWWCDRLDDEPTHMADWELAKQVAHRVYWGDVADPTEGALWYHATHVRAYWRGQYQKSRTIGNHVFYRDKPRRGDAGA
ncbi:MAG: cell wall hydrolase [Rhodospirillales bacterium]|nr:MAG: cell wall hydrolase [Rhodospirillales bacterium]